MGIAPSLVLIAVGAILKWGVTAQVNGLDIGTVGIILLIIGIFGLVLSLVFWSSWWGPGYWGGQRTVYTGGAAPATPSRRGYGARRVDVVEEEGQAPRGPAAPGEPLP